MSRLLARMARTLTHRWKRGLVVAVASLVVLIALAASSSPPVDDWSVPGTESQEAIDLFRAHTPALAGADATIVFSVEDGKIAGGEQQAAVEEALAEVRELPNVDQVADPFAEGGQLSPDGTLAAVDVRYGIEQAEVEKEDAEALEEAARTAEAAGVDVALRGTVVDIGQQQEAPIGELIGIALAIVLLTALFRSFAAMGATILGALLGVMVGQLLLAILAKPLGLPEFTSIIAVMLGLGAGIDYALLIIARYREQIAAGDSVRDASGKAAATAGSAVVAAGLIVMVAIAGLLVVGIPLIGKMGIGTAIAVAAVVVSALTFLPVMIGAFAKWLKPKRPEDVLPSAAFERWGTFVTARPWLSIAAGVLVLVIFAFPTTGLRLGQPDDGNKAEDLTQRVAYDRLGEAFGAGSSGPFLLAVDTPVGAPETEEQLQAIVAAVEGTPGIASVTPAAPSEDGEMATITAIPETSPQDERTADLLETLRDDVLPGATEGTEFDVYVGGNTAGFVDFSEKTASRLPVFIAAVIGLSVLLLMMAFRSLLIPLVSALFNLLSIGAAYGVVTAVFQEGIGAGLIGIDSPVPIISFIPVMMFAILFGLSMDYNVFLLSRMHEAYNEGDRPRASVIHGMARIGKVVLFAGLIMSSVFLAFVLTDDVISKMFGIGLGLAILIDVVIVRLIVAPAVVTLLGDKAWWLPEWLDRILPNVSLEGHLEEGVDTKKEQVPA
ncbi:MAG: MMPL family transporter [Solirubrobacteraceae bacterium]|nr:MMPL family transporter [Solirubrobacteraceae bacterium]